MDVVILNGGIAGNEVMRSIGPYKIAHWLRKHGHSCQIIDFVTRIDQTTLRQLVFKFATIETKIVAMSTTFISNTLYEWDNGGESRMPQHVIAVLRELKQMYPKIKFVLGGYMSEKLGSLGLFDATVMAYTEPTEDIMLEYLEHLKFGSPAPLNKILIPSFGHDKRVRYHYFGARTKKYNIETDDFKFSKQDNILPGEPLPLDVSHGCIFACRFCSYPHLGKKKFDYIRGMEYIEQEMLYNYETFGTTTYYMLDDTFNDSEYKMDAFLKLSQRLPFKINYAAYIRADLLARFPSMVESLQESGLWACFNGIETFHPTASKLIAKGWNGTHAKEYLPKLYHDYWKGKIHHHANFIVGITGDTPESNEDTLKWFIDNDMCSIRFAGLGLYGATGLSRHTVHSEFDKNAEKYGFTWMPDVKTKSGVSAWKNDNWDTFSADKFARELNRKAEPLRCVEPWKATALLWYGLTKEQILTTKHPEIDWSYVNAESEHFVSLYCEGLLNV